MRRICGCLTFNPSRIVWTYTAALRRCSTRKRRAALTQLMRRPHAPFSAFNVNERENAAKQFGVLACYEGSGYFLNTYAEYVRKREFRPLIFFGHGMTDTVATCPVMAGSDRLSGNTTPWMKQ